jgi:predicted kinase
MKTILVLKGLPACGKSTLALDMLKQSPGKYRRINKDSIRTMLVGNDFSFRSESMVENIQNYSIETALGKNFEIIVDNTNLREKYYLDICAIAKKIGDIQVIEKYIECPLEECLIRNKNRLNPVPEDLIKGMYRKYIEGKVVQERTVYFPPIRKTFEVDQKLPNAIIADIDGSLALNYSGRSYYDTTRFLEDSVNVPVADVVRTYKAKGYTIIILSGRDDISQADTETWLKSNDIPFDLIFLRITGDKRPDNIFKDEVYNKNIKGKFNVLFVLDDRQKVVDAHRANGISVFQVNPGNF